jgi:sigma-B regulation protein RsbU (phosphoserine phosphatase)
MTRQHAAVEHYNGPVPAERPLSVLLVDDQAIVAESIRRLLATEDDIQLHVCQEPSKALAMAKAVQPTVILQDLVMPNIDGLLLVKFFRASEATRQTPMIVLSSQEEPVVKARAFALGANDYLVKLPDKLELIARIRYHSRSYLNLLERNEAYRQLEESKRQLAEEVARAAHYVQSLLPKKLTGPVQADWRFVPSTQLGGDMFGYHWLDPDHLAMYLLDVSGHGVGASLLAVSAANLLSAQSLANVDFHDPGQVLAGLNDVFPMEKQHNQFFTIWYGVYRRGRRTLAFGNAGHPPPVLFTGPSAETATLHLLEAAGPGIGIDAAWDHATQVLNLDAYAQLLVYSDGVFEIERPGGSQWRHADFLSYLAGLPRTEASLMDRVLAHVRQLHGSDMLADDFSMMQICFS